MPRRGRGREKRRRKGSGERGTPEVRMFDLVGSTTFRIYTFCGLWRKGGRRGRREGGKEGKREG